MDMGSFGLFIKMVQQEYGLSESEILILKNRLLADDKEFEKTWKFFKTRTRGSIGGVDHFGTLLKDLLS